MHLRSIGTFGSVVSITILFAANLFAQNADLSGLILDPSKLAVRNAQVIVENASTAASTAQSEPQAKVKMYIFVPGQRFSEVRIGFRYPDDRQRHCFLNRPALTCYHGMTSAGLRSYCDTR